MKVMGLKIKVYRYWFGQLLMISMIMNSCSYSQSDTFSVFKNSFNIISSLEVDSTTLMNNLTGVNYENIDERDYLCIKIKSLNNKCGDNSDNRYTYKKVGKIDMDNGGVLLVYFIDLNKECPVDANELYYILCCYDEKGNIISEKIIGELYEEFGRSEYKYFKLSTSNANIKIDITTVEEIMNYDLDVINKDLSLETVYY